MNRDDGGARERTAALEVAAERAHAFLEGLDERHVAAELVAQDELTRRLGGPLAKRGIDPAEVVAELAEAADPGLVATAGPRYYGFVTGGSLPAALGADWLTSAWDQCAGFYVLSPAAAVIEDVTAGWLLDLFGLPSEASTGFATGAQGANVVGLAAARHAQLARVGWDVERRGLIGAPALPVIVGADAHATIFTSLRLLGLGTETATRVATDDQGAILAADLEAALERAEGPALVCAQAGNVATGAFDPIAEIAAACRRHGAWLHVDGAFGLWAACADSTRHLTTGIEAADSWAVDAHKWLNVPYDGAMAIVRDRSAHLAAMSLSAAYLVAGESVRDPCQLVPESSRRARAIPIYAALRSLGREGVAELVGRLCAHARLIAELLAREPGAEILNDVVLNQVLVRFGDADALTEETVRRVQDDGTCWLGGTRWRGRAAIRISISNWSTSRTDVERSAEAIARASRRAAAAA